MRFGLLKSCAAQLLPTGTRTGPIASSSRNLPLAAAVLRLSVLLLTLFLAACQSGIKDAELDDLKAQIKAEFKKKDQTVTTFLLSKDSGSQVSGMIHVDVETPMGIKTYYSTCLATMDPDSRKFDWHCDSVP